MKVALVFPRFRGKHTRFKYFLEPPMGLCYIASVLKENHIDVKIFDGTFDDSDTLIEKMKNYQPDTIGVHSNILTIDDGLSFAEKIKVVFINIPIVFGGPQPTVIPEEILKNENVDIVVVGEAEITFLDLINNLNNLEKVKGIYYKKGKKIVKNPLREFIKDLDSLPFPAYDLLNPQYFRSLYKVVIASRGCPFNCSFCQPTLRKLFGNLRLRSPKNVVAEIEFLVKNYHTDYILFHDDTFTFNKKWVIDICKLIIERNLKIRWICNGRVNTINKEMLEWMKKAGCVLIEFGVESGSELIRNSVLNKNVTNEQIENTFLLCHKVGIKSGAYVMIGSPGETKETLNETVELLKKIRPETIIASITTPMHGTYLYDICKEKNLIKAEKWSDFDFSEKISIRYEHITEKDIENVLNKIKFMSIKNYIFYNLKTLNFKELFEEIFLEPKRIPNVIKKCIKSIL